MTKILLVEDDKSLREIYGVRLLAEGYDIVSAGDGEQALAMAIKERPELIISDVMMPAISGFDMLDILRSTTETKDIKVIIMTALSSEDQRARGEALGADRYLVKSQVGIEDVVRTVHEVLGDAPVRQAVANASFGAPPASRQATPPPVVPARPTTAPLPPQPVAARPAATLQTSTPPSPQPMTPAAPPSFTPPPLTSSPLPQPTAPFSTTRPANLGERVIHPITPPAAQPDLSSRINEELNNAAPQPASPAMPQPTGPTPTTPGPVAPPSLAPPVQQVSPPDLSFEETPRSATAPPTSPPSVPPAA